MTDRSTPLPTARALDAAALRYALRRAGRGFIRHRGIDNAASLTFFSVLALFPVSLIVVSAFALSDGDEGHGIDRILDVLEEFLSRDALEAARAPLDAFAQLPDPGVALTIGIVLAIWSMGSYATAFGRAVDSVYEVQEGRPLWLVRPAMTLVALMLLGCFAVIVLLLLTTPSVADALADSMGVAHPWVLAFDIAKWPVIAAFAVLIVGVLYFATPNVKHPRIRWVSWGAMAAIVAWGLTTAGFGLYIATFDTYDRVYGWLGGAVALLLWLYITNLVLVLGAELDAELVRARQLAAGIAAEASVQLPLRSTRRNLVLARWTSQDEREGRALRERLSGED